MGRPGGFEWNIVERNVARTQKTNPGSTKFTLYNVGFGCMHAAGYPEANNSKYAAMHFLKEWHLSYHAHYGKGLQPPPPPPAMGMVPRIGIPPNYEKV